MTKSQAVVMLALLGGQLGLAFSVSLRQAPTAAPIVSAPARWGYRIEVIPDLAFDATMAAIGAQGWTVVSARRANSAGLNAPMVMAYEVIFQKDLR